MISIEEETASLNDLMEEAFGIRPIVPYMRLEDYHAWSAKLSRYWIERSREAAMKAESK